mgnify:CR=1 FL=1
MWPQIAREQLGAGNAGFATSWELPGSWEPGSLLRKTASWEAILGIKTTAGGRPPPRAIDFEPGRNEDTAGVPAVPLRTVLRARRHRPEQKKSSLEI